MTHCQTFTTTIIVLLGIFCCSCDPQPTTESSPEEPFLEVIQPKFQQMLDSKNLTGAILIVNPSKRVMHSNDFSYCQKPHLPASTFKIPHSMIALELGIVQNDSSILRWDGQPRGMKIWEEDLSLHQAFRRSCVPCYQGIARRVGVDRMNRQLEKLSFGQMQVDSSNLDRFWLVGNSHISMQQEIDFLQRLHDEQLPIQTKTSNILKKILVDEAGPDYVLRGKTGWSRDENNENNNGWYVGYLERGEATYFFATNIEPKPEFDMAHFPSVRKQITLEALAQLRLFD
ncbi:MAG: penicillin-binding transpeptidase domain-containing protein [Bacteroidota bacterium]